MKKVILELSLVTALILAGGCSWVKVSQAGKRVNIVSNDQVQHCTRVGTVTTSVINKIIIIPRNDKKVETELDRLARDQAVLMEANTLVRLSIVDGEGQYMAYRCPTGQANNPNQREGTSVTAHPID